MYKYGDTGPRVQVVFPEGEGRSKQAMRDECNINKIMAKFQKTGAVEHGNRFAGSYGFATSVSFHEAMNLVAVGESMFNALPGTVRRRFSHDVGEFLDFVQDPANKQEMIELGLSEPEAPPAGSPPVEDQEPPAGVSEGATSEAAEAAALASD